MDLIKESFVTESPDVTSIIAAFEAKTNPLQLFFKKVFRSPNYLEAKLNSIDNQIDELRDWLINCYPHVHQEIFDYKRCLTKLIEIEVKVIDLNRIYRQNERNNVTATCAKCATHFNLTNTQDVTSLENHKHVVDVLSQPQFDDFPIQLISRVRNHYRCLLCQVLVAGKKSVRSHVRGKWHVNKLNNDVLCEKICEFLKCFDALPAPYHLFKVLFDPAPQDSPTNVAVCTICAENVPIAKIPEHVTRNQVHRVTFETIDYYRFLIGYKEMLNAMKNDNHDIPSTSTNTPVNVNNVTSKQKKKHTVIASYATANDLIPNRLKNHMKFMDDATCTLCKYIVKSPHELMAHFLSDQHKLKCRTELIYYCYYCCICCKYFKRDIKWLEHMNSLAHKQKESLLPKQTIQNIFREYECINCSLVWYGKRHSVNAHKKDKFGSNDKRWKQKDITLSNEMVKLLKDEVAFAADVLKASKESNDVLNSIESAEKCCRAIEDALRSTFGEQIKAYPFGSRISGLGNIASDLDVFVDVGLMYDGTINQNAEYQTYCVQECAHALRRHKDFTDVCPIPQARTPIVQVFHKLTDLDCDLSFRHGLSIENTQFIKFCINVQPKLKTLILFLKKWIHSNKFRDRISTYGISLMSIYMMQNKGYLPSLAALRKIDPQQSKIIAGWETFNFQKPLCDLQISYPLYAKSERNLLAEFFHFYVNFDYEKLVICPLLGESIRKDYFLDASGACCLPNEMISYVRKIEENDENERIKITKSICLQDPFDLSHNVTKALPIEVLAKMIILMKKSHQLIQN